MVGVIGGLDVLNFDWFGSFWFELEEKSLLKDDYYDKTQIPIKYFSQSFINKHIQPLLILIFFQISIQIQ